MPSPTVLAAEYLTLVLVRRNGYGPADADRLAHLTGLPLMDCARLARLRDPAEIHSRRHRLDAYTTEGTA